MLVNGIFVGMLCMCCVTQGCSWYQANIPAFLARIGVSSSNRGAATGGGMQGAFHKIDDKDGQDVEMTALMG